MLPIWLLTCATELTVVGIMHIHKDPGSLITLVAQNGALARHWPISLWKVLYSFSAQLVGTCNCKLVFWKLFKHNEGPKIMISIFGYKYLHTYIKNQKESKKGPVIFSPVCICQQFLRRIIQLSTYIKSVHTAII